MKESQDNVSQVKGVLRLKVNCEWCGGDIELYLKVFDEKMVCCPHCGQDMLVTVAGDGDIWTYAFEGWEEDYWEYEQYKPADKNSRKETA